MADIKEQLEMLIGIQKFDIEIYKLEQEKGRMPKLAEECKADFENQQAKLAEIQNNLKSMQVKRKEKEIEIEVIRTSTQIQVKKGDSLCNGFQKTTAFRKGVYSEHLSLDQIHQGEG